MSCEYSPSCILVVPNFPLYRKLFIPEFKNENIFLKHACYRLPDESILCVYINNNVFERVGSYSESHWDESDDRSKVVYFKMERFISKLDILEIIRYLKLFSGNILSNEEQNFHPARTSDKVQALDEPCQISLLYRYCSNKKYGSSEELKDTLYKIVNAKCRCTLVVPNFPLLKREYGPEFILEEPFSKHVFYMLPDMCIFHVFINNKVLEYGRWFPETLHEKLDNKSEMIYFEIEGPVTKRAILKVICYLELYSGVLPTLDERLELGLDEILGCNSVQSLEDLSRMASLQVFISGKKFGNAEKFKKILMNFIYLHSSRLSEYIKNIRESTNFIQGA